MTWSWQKVVGIVFFVIAAGLMVFAIVSCMESLAHEGPIAWKITSFQPKYENQGLVIVITMISSVFVFLAGCIMISVSRKR